MTFNTFSINGQGGKLAWLEMQKEDINMNKNKNKNVRSKAIKTEKKDETKKRIASQGDYEEIVEIDETKKSDVKVVTGGLTIDKTNSAKDKSYDLPKGLTLRRLRKLFRMFCILRDPSAGQEEYYSDCDSCILSDVPCKNGTLCTAIWKDKVLDGLK